MSVEKLVGNLSNLAGIGAANTGNGQANGGVFEVLLGEGLSLEEQIKAKAEAKIAEHNARIQKEVPDAEAEFRELMEKDSAERLREIVLLSLGITEEELAAMPAEERAKMETKISQLIEDKIKMATEEELKKSAVAEAQGATQEGQAPSLAVPEVQEHPPLVSDERQKDDWLAALGLPESGKVQVGFNLVGELKMSGGAR